MGRRPSAVRPASAGRTDTRERPPARVEIRRRDGGLELRVDDTFASWYQPGETCTRSVWDAIAAPVLALPPHRRRRIAILGLGGGSVARVVRALAPEAELVGVEISDRVIRAARRAFGLDSLGVKAVRADARDWLRGGGDRFDAILDDVFVGRGREVRKPAWHAEEGLEGMRRRLAPGGLLVTNTLDEWRAVARAVRERFPAAVLIEVADYDNRIVVGGPAGLTGRRLRRAVEADPVLGPSCPALRFRSLRRAPPSPRPRSSPRSAAAAKQPWKERGCGEADPPSPGSPPSSPPRSPPSGSGSRFPSPWTGPSTTPRAGPWPRRPLRACAAACPSAGGSSSV